MTCLPHAWTAAAPANVIPGRVSRSGAEVPRTNSGPAAAAEGPAVQPAEGRSGSLGPGDLEQARRRELEEPG